MSNSISYATKTKFTALLDGKKIAINYQAFLVNANAFGTESHDENIRQRAIDRVQNKKDKVANYIADVQFIMGRQGKDDLEGAFVYKNNTNIIETLHGVFDEYEEDDFERVGTLLKIDGKMVLETNLEAVEKIRRQNDCDSMDKGFHSIGGITDSSEYIKYLAKVDAELGKMRTRGHGIS